MMYRKISPETGMWIEDVIQDFRPLLESGEPDPEYVETPVAGDAGFWWPRWNGTTWEEGGTAPEPVQPEPTPEEAWKISIEAALIELAAMVTGGV